MEAKRKDNGEKVILAGCIGQDENGENLYQTQMFEYDNSCEILSESELIFV